MPHKPIPLVGCSHLNGWRLILAFVGTCGAYSIGAWADSFLSLSMESLLLSIYGLVLWGCLRLCKRMALFWDGHYWYVRVLGSASNLKMTPGHIKLVFDWGGLMLLRWAPDPSAHAATLLGDRRPRYVPVQKWGHESSWHTLRCAVYSPASSSPSASVFPLGVGTHPVRDA